MPEVKPEPCPHCGTLTLQDACPNCDWVKSKNKYTWELTPPPS